MSGNEEISELEERAERSALRARCEGRNADRHLELKNKCEARMWAALRNETSTRAKIERLRSDANRPPEPASAGKAAI